MDHEAEKLERINIRCTVEQRELWDRAAKAERRNLSDWIRLSLSDLAEKQLKKSK